MMDKSSGEYWSEARIFSLVLLSQAFQKESGLENHFQTNLFTILITPSSPNPGFNNTQSRDSVFFI